MRRPTKRAERGDGKAIARALLRTAIGGTMIAHGVRHAQRLEGTGRWFESIGFAQPQLQAQASVAVEIGSGAAVLAGVATPLSTSAVVGTMGVAFQTVHKQNGYFVINEGWEYVAFVAAAAVGLSALGPGRPSVDAMLGVDTIGTPAKRALVTLAVGLAGAAAQVAAFWTKPPPAVS
jgi:putative oxidoreductase